MNKSSVNIFLTCAAMLVMATLRSTQASPTILDDFNVNSGHFTSTVIGGSGSTVGLTTGTSAIRVTTNSPVEGTGHQKLTLVSTNSTRVRHLSGSGTIANNIPITTSAGMDGWIGVYLKTEDATVDPNWTVQIWLEGGGNGLPQASTNNGSIPKTIIADGAWHLYEWNLDDFTGGPDSWGTVASIITGGPTVVDGNHTIDSIIFRNSTFPALSLVTNIIYLDFVARNDAGFVADLLLNPCLATSGVLVSGPISTNVNQVIVTGVSATATNLTVYQNTGTGSSMVSIGSKTSGVSAGNNTVTVSGLVKGAVVAATQKVNGQESCVPTTGLIVGGGANPSVRAALTIRETTSTGLAGTPGNSSSGNLHFLGATAVSGGAPTDAPVVYPSNQWQTVTFLRGTNEVVGDTANPTGRVVSAVGYAPNDTISIQAYAYRTLANGVTIYSLAAPQSSDVTSNDVFAVNWTWDAVAGAQGYRLLRSLNFAGFGEYQDVAANNLSDINTGWNPGSTVIPTTSQPGASVQWNPTTSNTNNLPGQWGILESLNFAINNPDDTGPFDLYIDNIQNGTNVFQTFEEAPANATDYGFRAPSFSGTTGGSILTAPDVGEVSNRAADTGTKSFHVRFQWSGTNAAKWLRLTTSGVNNPQVNLDEPISLRLLLQPVNATLPVAPTAPTVTVNRLDDKTVLSWIGGHRLQTSVNVSGTYTNVPQVLSPNTWTNITLGAFLAPWTNSFAEPIRFFRLAD